jgi:putative membrane protein
MPHPHHAAVESLWVFIALSLVAIVYLRRWLRVAWLVPNAIEGWRACSFFVGLLLVWAALGSPLSLLDHDLLTAHMVQHLLLMTLAPPLILLGVPLKLLPQRPVQRLVGSIVRLHPAIGWMAATATLIVWHIPGVFMLGLRSNTWHGIEQASFLVTGLLFWWPVVEPWQNALKWPESSILLYLFLATLPCDILSGFLVFCDRVVYPVYLFSPRFGLTVLEDQQCAGALMWTCVTIVYVVAGAFSAARILSPRWSPDLQSESQAIAVAQRVAHRDSQRMEAV